MRIIKLPPDTPVGFRFQPNDEEIMNHFLRLKMIGKLPKKDDVIAELDFCSWDPWDLPDKSKIQSDDQMWWFLCCRDHIDSTSKRCSRKTKSGFWKITGKERDIKDQRTKKCIGKKKILVFHKGPAPGRGTNWVMHEYHPLPNSVLPNQRPYVICRLEKTTDRKVITPGPDQGEPSASIISESNIENPKTPSAISEVPGQVEENPETPGVISEVLDQAGVNAEPLLQPPLSPDGCLNGEDIRSIFSDIGNDDQRINLQDCHPDQENPLPQKQHDVTCPVVNKTDGKAGTLYRDIGETRGIITSDVKNQAAPPAIPEVDGHVEVDAESLLQSFLSPNFCLSEKDMHSILFDDDEKIKLLQHKPEQGNPLPRQWPNVICNLENKTDEQAGTPSCDIGEQSGIIASDIGNKVHCRTGVNAESSSKPLFSLDCYLTVEEMDSILSTNINCDDNEKQGLCGGDEPEVSPAGFSDMLIVDPYGNYYNGETSSNLFNTSIQPMSLKRPYIPDLASSGADAVGVDGRVKRPRSLAHGDSLH